MIDEATFGAPFEIHTTLRTHAMVGANVLATTEAKAHVLI